MPHQKVTPYEAELRLRVGYGTKSHLDGESLGSSEQRRTLRPDGTPDWHILLILEGTYHLNAQSKKPTVLPPGHAILFPPHTAQDYMLKEGLHDGKTFWAHFHPEVSMLPMLDWSIKPRSIKPLRWDQSEPLRSDILNAISRCVTYYESDYSRKRALALLTLEEIFRLLQQVNPNREDDEMDDRIKQAIQYIAQNIKEPLSIEQVASAVGLSSSRFSHLFTLNLHCSMMEYLEKQRVRLACRLLEITPLPMSQIAEDCGFSSSYYFSKRFKKVKKMTPTDYRDSVQSEVS